MVGVPLLTDSPFLRLESRQDIRFFCSCLGSEDIVLLLCDELCGSLNLGESHLVRQYIHLPQDSCI